MSHTTTIDLQFKHEAAILAAARELNLPVPVRGTASLYQSHSKNLSGLIVRLPGWKFPVIIDTATGTAQFDNYNGMWGSNAELNKFKQLYGVHAAQNLLRQQGKTFTRKTLTNGSIQLTINA